MNIGLEINRFWKNNMDENEHFNYLIIILYLIYLDQNMILPKSKSLFLNILMKIIHLQKRYPQISKKFGIDKIINFNTIFFKIHQVEKKKNYYDETIITNS